MVRSVVSIIVAAALIIAGGIFECLYLDRTFDELTEVYSDIYEKLENDACTVEDSSAAMDVWFDKKEQLHAFIPHTEIKEVDLWAFELNEYVAQGENEEAKAKAAVILGLFDKIPRSFSLRAGNLL
ncbi:MAG: DUF4363 family protein [Clostridia bacterium]|nr:DUF4363 family protein [Clostridia bacterium]